jgi:hypothetical protein
MTIPGGLTMIDVAIGLIVVYVLMSLLCSSFNEGLESFMKVRSRMLERGIREMLNDNGGHLTEDLYNHPLVNGLFQGKYDKNLVRPGNALYTGTNLPSYIPATNFALAILDMVVPSSATQQSGATGVLNDAGAGASRADIAQTLRQAAANFPVPYINKNLTVLIDASGNDLVMIRKGIEGWFDSSMDRVSGWYKRRTQILLFSIGLLLAGSLNVDTVHIVNRLLSDPAYRSSLVATAQEFAEDKDMAHVKENNQKLQDLGVPVGWGKDERPTEPWGWLIKIAGILATALATTMGAPFWFDVLNRFVVIRSTIKPAEKSKPEASKD